MRLITTSKNQEKQVFKRLDNILKMSNEAGKYPFTRGIYDKMYRKKLWTMRQYAGFTSAKESNKRYRYLIDEGVTGLSVAFDLPTQIGYDSDHSMASGEVGKVGVPISSTDDMNTLFDKISLDKVSTSMTINSTAATLLSFYIILAEKNGIHLDRCSINHTGLMIGSIIC